MLTGRYIFIKNSVNIKNACFRILCSSFDGLILSEPLIFAITNVICSIVIHKDIVYFIKKLSINNKLICIIF